MILLIWLDHVDGLNFLHTEELDKNIQYILYVYPIKNVEVKILLFIY